MVFIGGGRSLGLLRRQGLESRIAHNHPARHRRAGEISQPTPTSRSWHRQSWQTSEHPPEIYSPLAPLPRSQYTGLSFGYRIPACVSLPHTQQAQLQAASGGVTRLPNVSPQWSIYTLGTEASATLGQGDKWSPK